MKASAHNRKRLKILIVAFPGSIHTQRWIRQLRGTGWEICLWHPTQLGRKPTQEQAARELARLIRKLRPDLIHTLGVVTNSHTARLAREILTGDFPPWIVSDWGNDLSFYSKLQEHRSNTCAILRKCDFFWSESERDMKLAKDWGFRGKLLPVLPIAGGFDLSRLHVARQGSPSSRDWILVKAYQNERGRALVALEALELCAPLLRKYRIGLYGTQIFPESTAVAPAVERLSKRTGLQMAVLPLVKHAWQVRRHGKARLSIGLSLNDGISTSFLEAMIMGSYPIQSDTSSADEWIRNGVSGAIVPPDEPELVAKAIERAVRNDSLVDRAARINWKIALNRLDYEEVRKEVIRSYEACSR